MMKPEDWQSVLNENLGGTFNMNKFAVLSMMRKRYGRIINITSPCGDFGFAGLRITRRRKPARSA